MYLLKCSKCRDWLCPTDFALATKTKRGRKNHCKQCQAVDSATYRANHKPEKAAYARKYAAAHPDRMQASDKRYKKKHPQKIKQSRSNYRASNQAKHINGVDLEALGDQWCSRCETWKAPQNFARDAGTVNGIRGICKACRKAADIHIGADVRRAVTSARWAEEHPAQAAANRRSYAMAHPDRMCASSQRYRKKHPEKVKKMFANWRKANPDKDHARTAKRRARRKQAPIIEIVNRIVVFTRDRWICQICFKKVSRTLKYPDPGCASLDHIVPLADGGSHTYANVVLAHMGCNSSKRDRHKIAQQIRLF